MSDESAFVRALMAAPNDDAPRLIFADWLEENGRDGRPLRLPGYLTLDAGRLCWQVSPAFWPAAGSGEADVAVGLPALPCSAHGCGELAMFAVGNHWFCPMHGILLESRSNGRRRPCPRAARRRRRRFAEVPF